jgi:hypothetical protein
MAFPQRPRPECECPPVLRAPLAAAHKAAVCTVLLSIPLPAATRRCLLLMTSASAMQITLNMPKGGMDTMGVTPQVDHGCEVYCTPEHPAIPI